MELIKQLIEFWVGLVGRFAWCVLGIVFTLTCGLGLYTADNLSINTNTTDMLSDELPFRQDYIAYKEAFPQTNDLITIVIDASSPDRADISALAFAERLRQESGFIENVYDFEGASFFRQNALLYRDIDELEKTADRLAQVQGLLSTLSSDISLRGLSNVLSLAIDDITKGNAQTGNLAILFNKIADVVAMQRLGIWKELSWQTLISDNNPNSADLKRFLQVRVKADWSSLAPAAPAMEMIRRLATELDLTPENGVRVRLTGGLALSTEELSSVFEGAKAASFLALVLVFLCLQFGLRSFVLVCTTIVTLICGLIWTTAFAAFAVGHLNLLSVAFAVLFIGLGVDFGIHFVLRYVEEFPDSEGREDALKRTVLGISGPMTLCAVSAAIGFYAFLPTAYLGLAELGLISGTSMFIALFMSLTLLPALLVILPYRSGCFIAKSTRKGLADIVKRNCGKISGFIVLLSCAVIWLVPFIRFDFDPLNLHDSNSESLQTTLELIRESENSPKTISVLQPDLNSARKLAKNLERLDEVSTAVTAASFIPAEQKEKLDIIGDLNFILLPILGALPPNKESTIFNEADATKTLVVKLKSLSDVDGQLGLSATRLHDELNSLTNFGKNNLPLNELRRRLLNLFPHLVKQLNLAMQAKRITLSDVPKELLVRYLASSGIARVEVAPSFSVEENTALLTFITTVKKYAPNATDSPVVILEASKVVVESILQAAIIAGVAILAILLVLLRNIRDVLLVFYPLVVAGLLTVASAVVFDLPFNFANVIVLPLLMGLGVASGIHLVVRARTSGASSHVLITGTPRAVTFSALTTILSFGSLAISDHRGTASMGILLTIAITYTLFGSLIALPAMMCWLDKRRLRRA